MASARAGLAGQRWLPWLALGGSAAILVWGGFFLMFFHFSAYDDEGYLLISLQSFLRGGHLYSQVYSEYGPLFHEVMGLLFAIPGFAPSLQHGRLVTLGIWVLSSLLVGASAFKLSGRLLLGLAAEWSCFSLLFVLINEPMHPIGLMCLQAALLMSLVAFVLPRHRRLGLLLVGGLVASILLVKANVGAFTAVGVSFWLSAALSPPKARRWLVALAALAMIVGPLALIALLPSPGWGPNFGFLLALSGLAMTLVTVGLPHGQGTGRLSDFVWAAGGGFALGTLSIAAILVLGTSPAAVISGTLVAPLAHPQGFFIPLRVGTGTVGLAALSVVASGLYVLFRRTTSPSQRSVQAEAALRVVVGALLFLGAASSNATVAALVWIIVVPPLTRDDGSWAGRVSPPQRILLAAVALLWTLNVYPVDGSQRALAELPALLVGVVAISDGWLAYRSTLAQAGRPRTQGYLAAGLAAVLLLSSGVISSGQLIVPGYAAYQSEVPLGLPGANGLRLPVRQAATFRLLVSELHAHCATFYSEPGFNSLYFFANDRPPTLLNSSSWIVGMTEPQQKEIVDQLRPIAGLCIVRSQAEIDYWLRGRKLPQRALVRYIEGGFRPLLRVGGYQVLIRRISPAP